MKVSVAPLRTIDVATDSRTVKLVKAATAVQAGGLLPATSARQLVSFAKSVRLFAEASEFDFAASMLDAIDTLAATHDDESLPTMLKRHTDDIRKAIRRETAVAA